MSNVKNEWRKSTAWVLTCRGFPAGWITISRCNEDSWHWEITLVDVTETLYGHCDTSLARAKREALLAYEAWGERLHLARGGQ